MSERSDRAQMKQLLEENQVIYCLQFRKFRLPSILVTLRIQEVVSPPSLPLSLCLPCHHLSLLPSCPLCPSAATVGKLLRESVLSREECASTQVREMSCKNK